MGAPRQPLPIWQASAIAVLATTATLVLRLALDAQLEGRPTLVIFTMPIMLAGYLGGWRAGLLATALSCLQACYFVLLPLHSLAVAATAERWQLVFVALAGIVISALNEALHRARRRADDATREHAQAEAALVTAGALKSAIFNSANFASIATDAAGHIQIFNVGAERMLGYTAAEVVHKLSPADLSDAHEMKARAQALSLEFGVTIAPGLETLTYKASRGLPYIYEPTLIRKDGSRIAAVVSVTALRDAQDAISGYLLIGTDNTARKLAEEALLKAGALQSAIFNSVNFSSIATDAAGVIQIFNVGAERMLGYSAADVMNRITPADISDPRELVARAQALSTELDTPIAPGFEALVFKASRGIEDIYELTYIRKDGSRLPAVVSVTALRDANEGIIGYLLIGTDNTARKLAEEALVKAGALQSAIFNSANFSSIATDAQGVIQIFNVGAERMLGYTAADVMDKITPADISDPREVIAHARALSTELGEAIAPGFEALVFKASRGIEDIYELTYIRKDGSRVPAVVSVTALRDAQEGIIGYLLIGTDNTARKHAEAAMRENDALLRTIHMHSIVSVTDRRGRIVEVNDSFCRISGYRADELVGQTHRVVNSGVQPAQFWDELWRSIAAGKPWRGEICNRTKAGELYWVDSIIAPLMGEDGRTHKYISIRSDITARKRNEETLRLASQTAEQANRAKSEFLANMSHEIRTPMNAVIGLSYLLGQTALNPQQSAFVAKVTLAGKSLLAVLNNVLDLSKIEAGELIVERAPFSLPGLLQELRDVMAVQADAKGIAFEIDAPDALPAALEGDAARLHQILANLLSNAIKFTDRGNVRLRVRQLAGNAESATLCFEVHDTGIGVAPEVQARLFKPFAQADASITRRFGGTGLGLSIVERLVGLLGGTVTLDSAPGVGSEFSVLLDFGLASPQAVAQLEAPPVAAGGLALLGLRVLVVDDSDINLDVTQRILELEGARVVLAHNGQEAIERLQAEPGAVDVVLMDVQMPVLDGHDATQRIRGELQLTQLPIIALTAGAMSSERARAMAAGMDDYLVKPFDAAALVRGILRHVKPAGAAPAPSLRLQLPPPALPWPEIEGIEPAGVRERLGGDFGLFRSILLRLLTEFADVSMPVAADGAALARHAARMHKLRGSAGMLGALEIQRLAGAAEAACAAADARGAARLAADLASHLQRLAQGATRIFVDEPLLRDGAPLAAAGAPDPRLVTELIGLLRQQSLAALDRFGAVAPELRRRLGERPYARLLEQVENLQFGEAADALEAAS
jgi:PAS domain S-box-containing protein